MKPKEILEKLKKDGWAEVRTSGSHIQLKHPTKQGKVTVPYHNKDLKKATENSILKQAGLK